MSFISIKWNWLISYLNIRENWLISYLSIRKNQSISLLNLIKISEDVFHEILYLTWVRRKHDWSISSNIQLRNHQFQLILVKSAILVKKLINFIYYSDKKLLILTNTSEICYSSEEINWFLSQNHGFWPVCLRYDLAEWLI